MERNEAIEIPFGVFDSELKGWEYTIPEGMEAEIKDGKIIVREKESEDEKRVVELKTFIAHCNGFNKANRQKAFDLIDALHPQTQWKPSDEQIISLDTAIAWCIGKKEKVALKLLLSDLKKLRAKL